MPAMFNLFVKIGPMVSGNSSVKVIIEQCPTLVKAVLHNKTQSDLEAITYQVIVNEFGCNSPVLPG